MFEGEHNSEKTLLEVVIVSGQVHVTLALRYTMTFRFCVINKHKELELEYYFHKYSKPEQDNFSLSVLVWVNFLDNTTSSLRSTNIIFSFVSVYLKIKLIYKWFFFAIFYACNVLCPGLLNFACYLLCPL